VGEAKQPAGWQERGGEGSGSLLRDGETCREASGPRCVQAFAWSRLPHVRRGGEDPASLVAWRDSTARTIHGMRLAEESLIDDNLTEILEFVRDSNPTAQETWGWDAGRFVDWRWGSNTKAEAATPGWFAEHGRVFRLGGGVAALALAEYGGDEVCILTETPSRQIVASVIAALDARRSDDGAGLRLTASESATWLTPVLEQSGFVETRRTAIEWEYRLADVPDTPRLPAGFTVETLSDERSNDYAGIAECIKRAFNSDADVHATLRSLEANPMFRPDLSVFIRSPEGRVAAYCRGTVDPVNGVSAIDPVCTHPDFGRMGLGQAVVRACFRTQRALGGRFSYIGSAPDPAPSTNLYRSLGPSSRNDFSTWSRSLRPPDGIAR
jgi:ribosomal protein S18 acetylase RimI-like enzyme